MNMVSLGNLAVLTLRQPSEAARHLMDLRLGREVLWLAFFLAVVLNCLVQLGIDLLVPIPEEALRELEPVPLVLIKSAGAMMLSIVAFLYIGRFLGGTATFEGMMVLTIWLQFLQIAALLITLALSITFPFMMLMLLLATALLSLYITLHFLNEAHQFGSLAKAFAVILLSALVAVPFVLMLTPSGPV
ncbi:YIP1 family protein [Rhodobacteraceae bacterium B1Z28]|uniref:YIP1 family protein n=1 Tax=Ruegeria haliotis TaxID=2747601 RepID=A0ABX2PNG1_9RHOB|nr:YIP1 family protein [Ruegeria haliotis]NVO55280.1 YIP1 family protein [Ruegeria haliotis]